DNNVTSIGGWEGWTDISDARFKTNIKETVPGLDFILTLRPVTYNMDPEAIASFLKTPDHLRNHESETEKANTLQTGFIAQEVEAAANYLGYSFSGIDAPKNENDYYGLRYAEFVVPLVKAVQELVDRIGGQQTQIEVLKRENEELRAGNDQRLNDQQQQIHALQSVVQELKAVLPKLNN
ncbi:MAG TPA: tail fiber domain-containing protein, partial [Saprospiraceae bacterium]|nr:tail fiber domain-containing protein [Saprospiraceae bacterium]